MKETHQTLKSLRPLQQETARQMQRTDAALAYLTKRMEAVGISEDSLKFFTDEMVFPLADRLLRERGIELKELYGGLSGKHEGDNIEFDIIGAGPEAAILIEVKLKLKRKHVEELIDNKLPDVFKFFPHLRRPKLYGGTAGMSLEKDVERFAYKRGIFVFGASGDNIRILNDEKFKPRTYAK